MKARTTIAAGLTAAALLTCSVADAVEIRGFRSCGQWVKDRDRDVGARYWLLGYLSALASVLEIDALKGTDNESIYLWMDNYCKQNPLKDVDNGGAVLFFELKQQKGLK